MGFSIALSIDFHSEKESTVGVIEIDSFQEHFIAPLTYWSADDYKRHWKLSIERILKLSATSCLITSMLNPAEASFIFWWPMYLAGDTVFIQNQILFFDKLEPAFDEGDIYASIPERQTVDVDGNVISEWSIHRKDLEDFLVALVASFEK